MDLDGHEIAAQNEALVGFGDFAFGARNGDGGAVVQRSNLVQKHLAGRSAGPLDAAHIFRVDRRLWCGRRGCGDRSLGRHIIA